MKIRNLTYPLLLLLATCWLAGCGNLFTGEGMEPPIVNPDDDPDAPDDPDNPARTEEIPIMLTFTDPSYNNFGGPSTRGRGPFSSEGDAIDEEAGTDVVWSNAVFYVYAFHSDDPDMSFEVQRSNDKEVCLLDGSTESEPAKTADGQYHGRKMKLNPDKASPIFDWVDTRTDIPYYSTLHQSRKFNFFAYYLDDAVVSNMVRNTEQVAFDVEIDGTQDILCTAARFTSEQEKNNDLITNASERLNVKNYRYSTYTGHRNYMPVFTFPHLLTLLKFEAYGGELAARDITINSISLMSRYKARMVVAAKDTTTVGATFQSTEKELFLKGERDENGLFTTLQSCPITFADDDVIYQKDAAGEVVKDEAGNPVIIGLNPDKTVYDRKANTVGCGYMMPVPASQYTLLLKLTQTFHDGRPPKEYLTTYDVAPAGGFVPGKKYTLRIAVYGPQLISIQVEITGWSEGGNVNIDFDNPDRFG